MQIEPLVEAIPETDFTDDSITALTVGDILRLERERLALDEKEVADQLHITMHYVKALESNSYEKLPGAVFAKGYLKSYAVLLGLDVEDLMSRYDEIAHQQKADSEQERRLLRARKKKDRNKPFVIISLIAFVAGFLGLWLANSYFGEESVSEVPSTAKSPSGAGSAEDLRPALPQAVEEQVTTQPQLSLEVETEEASTQQLTRTSPTLEEVVAALETLGDVDSGNVKGVESLESGEGSEAESTPSLEDLTTALQALGGNQVEQATNADADQPRVIAIGAIGPDVLRISFTGESWVEVNDSDSQQIYRDIRAAGDVLEITGSAPFNILLGDAPFTSMSLNGDEIDLSADIRIDNSARLTVGL